MFAQMSMQDIHDFHTARPENEADSGEGSAFVADLLLLMRLVFGDETLTMPARDTLDRIANRLTNFQGGGAEIARLLGAFGPVLPIDRAYAAFQEMDLEQRSLLARQVMAIAGGDSELARRRSRIVARLQEILNLTTQQIEDLQL